MYIDTEDYTYYHQGTWYWHEVWYSIDDDRPDFIEWPEAVDKHKRRHYSRHITVSR